MNKGLIRGGESTSHDSGNDILYTIKETKQQVLIEGDEYHLCKAALMNNEIHEYKNKTNKQILEDIYTRSSCMVKEGEANVGDFIICKLAVRDKKKRNLTGTIAEIVSIMQKEHGCRVVDGAEYEKMKKGGSLSKTFAPKKERIYGSKRNPKGTSATGDTAKSIKFSESTLETIKNKVDEHNKKHPNKKITLPIAKAVVRRGMGAYSSTHRPTIKGGKPNSRVAWGLARLNAFLYKAVKGESKSGKYSQDNDLLDELGIKHKEFAKGGSVLLAPNGKPSNLNEKQWHLVRTPEFKAWFGDWENSPETASKVVDENGEPLVVYHGTNAEFNKFDITKIEGKDTGFHFGTKEAAKEAAKIKGGERLIPIFLNIKNIIELQEYNRFPTWNGWEVISKIAEKLEGSKILTEEQANLIDQVLEENVILEYTNIFGEIEEGEYPIYGKQVEQLSFVNNFLSKFNLNGVSYTNIIEDAGSVSYIAFSPEQIKLADGTNTTFDGNNPDIRYGLGGEVKNIKLFHGNKSGSKIDSIIFDDKKYFYLTPTYRYALDYAKGNVNGINEYEIDTSRLLDLRSLRINPITPKYFYEKTKQYFPSKLLSKNINKPLWELVRLDFDGEIKKVFSSRGFDGLIMIENKNNELFESYVLFNSNPIKKDLTETKFEDGGEVGFQPPYPINEAGGYEYTGKAKETAKKVDLLSLPRNVNGTHCGNCFFQEQGICVHKGIMLPVTERMCCAVWDNSNSERSYEKNIEKDKGKLPENVEQFPKNKDGGYEYSGEALETAKKFDLITLPKKIEGTNCSNCGWFSPYKDGGFCFKSSIWLPVTARMSCASWNSLSVERDWGLFKQGGSVKDNKEIDTSKWQMPSRKIYEYAEKIRTKHKDVWDLGGNVFGNEAYKNLEKVIKRGHWLPSEEWMYKKWQAFMARHEGDFRIAGVIANLKWLNWVKKGEAYSKSLIESEIREQSIEKKMKGGEISTEVENIKRGLKMLVGNNLFRDSEFKDEFYYKGNRYYIDFIIGTDNAITEDVVMVVHRDFGGDEFDEIVLLMQFDMNKFDFNYDEFYEVFPKAERIKLNEGGIISGKFGEKTFPEIYIPNSFYIPQSIKNQIEKKSLPKQIANFPYKFDLLQSVDLLKNIYSDDALRPALGGIYLMGDFMAATDAHKLSFIGLSKKQYGAYWIPDKKTTKFLMDNNEPLEKIFKAEENNDWVKNVKEQYHPILRIIPQTLKSGGYEFQSRVDILSLYKYLYFVSQNNLLNRTTNLVSLSYQYENEKRIIGFNSNKLIDICELYAKFGYNHFYVYCSSPNKAVYFSIKPLDIEVDLISETKDNILSLLMPMMAYDEHLGSQDIDFGYYCPIYFDLFRNKIMNESGKPDDLTSKSSILSENEFQFIKSSFNKSYAFVKNNGNLGLFENFREDYIDSLGINGKHYYEMSPKELKLAFALSWINPFL